MDKGTFSRTTRVEEERPQEGAARRLARDPEAPTETTGADQLTDGLSRRPSSAAKLGRYILIEPLGEGGMGVVYVAYDPELHREVAIKLRRGDRAGRVSEARFQREAQAMARLNHPNVVAIHDVGVFDADLFVAMEIVRGETLGEWRRAEARTWREIIDMYVQAGRGLAAAHAAGLVHHDFKPANVLVDHGGVAKVTDFGLVRTVGEVDAQQAPPSAILGALETPLTHAGAVMGTPAYMAPEQLEGYRGDVLSDQFSFCVALYEALYGARPYLGETLSELKRSFNSGQSPPAVDGRVPRWIHEALARGLSTRAADRFPDMEQLLGALTHDPFARRRRVIRLSALVTISTVVAVALVLGGIELLNRWQERRYEARVARALQSLELQIEQARASGERERAAEMFNAFVTSKAHEGTRAVVRAWIGEGERRLRDDELEGARSAYAAAFSRASTRALRGDALLGLASSLRRSHRWAGLTASTRSLTRDYPALADDRALRRLTLELALADGRLREARRMLPSDDPRRRVLDSLTRAAPTELRGFVRVWPFDVEGDGEREYLAHQRFDSRDSMHIVDAAPSLPIRDSYSLEDGRVAPIKLPSGVGGVVGYTPKSGMSSSLSLYRPRPGGLLERLSSWKDGPPGGSVSADFDGDGALETLIGTGPYSRRIFELTRGSSGWRQTTAFAPGARKWSDIHDLAAADIDADGELEVIAAAGPWNAYDLRVFERGEDGVLTLLTREKLGTVIKLRTLRAADGGVLIAALKINAYAHSSFFPEGEHFGASPGVYVYRLDPATRSLVEVAYQPFPSPTETPDTDLGWVLDAADVDGDGLEDLGVAVLAGGRRMTMLLQQSERGEFSSLLLGSGGLVSFAELDDDPGAELLIMVDEAGDDGDRSTAAALWVLGAGDEEPPSHGVEDARGRGLEPREFAAPALELGWGRASELLSMGLEHEAARSLRELAASATRAAASGRRV